MRALAAATIAVAVVFFCVGAAASEFARFSKPQATTTGVAGLIEEDLARKAVALKCRERWARAAIGEPIRCCDDNGRLVAYMFPVKPNADVFPSDEELLAHARAMASEHDGKVDWRAGTFWTFVVSARESDYPIPTYSNTLPPYFVMLAKAAERAGQALNSEHVVLSRYYFLGHRGEYFEFAANGQSVLVHAQRLRRMPAEQVLVRRGMTATQETAARASLSAAQRDKLELMYQSNVAAWDEIRSARLDEGTREELGGETAAPTTDEAGAVIDVEEDE